MKAKTTLKKLSNYEVSSFCRQMALRMNGSLDIDPEFTRGTRFVLNLEA